jgi:hypothetical protein
LDEKERVKNEKRQREFDEDKVAVMRAIHEAEEVKRKEEDKKTKLRQQQSQYVMQSKLEKGLRDRAQKVIEQQDYEKAVVHNSYFEKREKFAKVMEERKQRFE